MDIKKQKFRALCLYAIVGALAVGCKGSSNTKEADPQPSNEPIGNNQPVPGQSIPWTPLAPAEHMPWAPIEPAKHKPWTPIGPGSTVADIDAPPAPYHPNYISFTFKNQTNGKFKDEDIYIQFVRQGSMRNGAMAITSVKMDNSLKQLFANNGTIGRPFQVKQNSLLSTTAFTLKDLKNHTLYLPTQPENNDRSGAEGLYDGSRIFISLGKPLNSLKVNDSGDGYSQPNVSPINPSPETIPFQFIEFSFNILDKRTDKGFFNISNVDFFSFPIWMTLTQNDGSRILNQKKHPVVGVVLRDTDKKYSTEILESRESIIKKYREETNQKFQSLLAKNDNMIVAPAIYGTIFNQEKVEASDPYFDEYIQTTFESFTKENPLRFCDQDRSQHTDGIPNCYQAYYKPDDKALKVWVTLGNPNPVKEGGQQSTACVSKDEPEDNNQCMVDFPTSPMVFTGWKKPFTKEEGPDYYTVVDSLASQLDAALLRHVAMDKYLNTSYARWADQQYFFQNDPYNEYMAFLHKYAVDGLAYASGYDDNGGFDPSLVVPGDQTMSNVTVGIGW